MAAFDYTTPAHGNIHAPGGVADLSGTYAGRSRTATRAVGQGELAANILDFASTGISPTDDLTVALAAAHAQADEVLIPTRAAQWTIGTRYVMPANKRIRGNHKRTTVLIVGAAVDAFDLGDGAHISHLTVDGNAPHYSARGMLFSGVSGRQTLEHVTLRNFDQPCLYFSASAGSQFLGIGLDMSRVNALTGTGRYAVVIDPAFQNGAVPRKFVAVETQGTCAFDFGGCNDTFITASVLGDLNFTANTRGVNITASRWLNQAACTIDGHNNSIVGCDVNPVLTLAPNCDVISIGPGSLDGHAVVDNSGNSRNLIHQAWVPYTPAFGTTTGGVGTLGNGTLVGLYNRHGATVTFEIHLTWGSTSTFADAGQIYFALPAARADGNTYPFGASYIAGGGTVIVGPLLIVGATSQVLLRSATGGALGGASIGTGLVAGDQIHLAGTYQL